MATVDHPSGSRSFLLRLRGWFASLPSQLQKWRTLPARLAATLRGRNAAVAGGVGAAVLAAVVFMAIPRGPEAQVERAAVSGKALYDDLLQAHPGVARSSRIDEGEARGSGTNLIVLPKKAWDALSVAQRNSLGTWLNAVGGRWEIRVGEGSEDGQRVLDAEAVVTSQEWNQHLR